MDGHQVPGGSCRGNGFTDVSFSICLTSMIWGKITLSPIIMEVEKLPIKHISQDLTFHFHDYGRKIRFQFDDGTHIFLKFVG